MDWPISWQKVKDLSNNTGGGGSGSGFPVIDLTGTRFPPFSGDPVNSEIELDQASIDTLREMHGKGPIVVKYMMTGEAPTEAYYQIILTETFSGPFSAYAGVGMLDFLLCITMEIAPEDADSAYEGKWTATLRALG